MSRLLARIGLAASLSLAGAASASAMVIFDNGLPNTASGHGIGGAFGTADDFTLSSAATLQSVGFYFQTYEGITGWDMTVDYTLRSFTVDGDVIDSGAAQNVAAEESAYAWCCGGGNAWLVTFDLESPVALDADQTYWLELSNAGATGAAWWVTTDYVNGSNRGSVDFAFYLEDGQVGPGADVPLPATAPLVAAAMAGLGLLARRRRA